MTSITETDKDNNIYYQKSIKIEQLFNQLLSRPDISDRYKQFNDYDLINCLDLDLKTVCNVSGKISKINFVSRHKTEKDLIKITTDKYNKSITVTTDHVCMILNRNNFFESINAVNLKPNQTICIYLSDGKNKTVLDTIKKIENIGKTENYVYDLEIDDQNHTFFGNDILIHNSQFANIQCITEYFRKKYPDLPEKLSSWPDDYKLKLWKFVDNFVNDQINPYVQNLISDTCFVDKKYSSVLKYSLEYIGDAGIYEQKKRYCVHKILSEGPEICDKLKYTGIELKRSNVSPALKTFLKEIYENTILNNWTNSDYVKYITDTYEKFCKLDINDIAFYKGWSSDKVQSEGFLKGGKGMTGISKCCHFHNEMINHLKIGKKYDTIQPGKDKVRMCYILPNNQFQIDCIAFNDNQYPEEFKDIFSVDYMKMFTKTILDPLKSFRVATKFQDVDPSLSVVSDIFSL